MRHFLSLLCLSTVAALAACSSSAAQSSTQMAPGEVVATVGSTKVTLGEVDERALQQPAANFGGARLVQALYLSRRAAVEEIVATLLLDTEAKTQGVNRETLIAREITGKVVAPTEADIEFWHQTNPDRVQGRPLAQLHDAIKAFLINVRSDEAREAYLNTLRAKSTVTIMLDPPRLKVATAGQPSRGPASAPIELVEFSDFQCPFCQQANPTVERVLKTYGDKIKFVYRHYPLPSHSNARPAAEAASCADAQGKFWEFHDRLFASSGPLTDTDLKAHATALGLDINAFNTCFDGHQTKPRIETDIQEAESVGVTATPTFFINGRPLEGAQPFESFKRIIDEELAHKH